MQLKRLTLSLRARLFLLAAVALAPALLILAYNEIAFRRSREAEVHALALRLGQLASLEMERIVGGIEGMLRAVARAPVVRSFNNESCQAYLADVQAQSPHLGGISAVALDGSIHCRSGASDANVNLADRPYFRDAIRTGQFVVGEHTVSRFTGRPAPPLATPIRNESGEVIGVLAAALDLDWLGARLRDRDFAKGSALTIADRNGVIIAREPFPERFIGTRIPEPFLALVRGGAPGSQEVVSQDGTRRIIGYIPATMSPTGLYVSSGLSRDEAFGPIDEATRRGVGLVVLGSILAFLAAWVTGRQTVQKPVERLVSTIETWRGGDPSARTAMVAEAGELERVGAAIDGLIDELAARQVERDRAEAQQHLLVQEMNHRVKNTLAMVQAVALQTFRGENASAEARAAFQASSPRSPGRRTCSCARTGTRPTWKPSCVTPSRRMAAAIRRASVWRAQSHPYAPDGTDDGHDPTRALHQRFEIWIAVDRVRTRGCRLESF